MRFISSMPTLIENLIGLLAMVNENLLKNQQIWKAKLLEIEERERRALRLKDDKIQNLEEQLRDLMVHIETENTVEQLPTSSEIKDGMVLPISIDSSKSNTKPASRTVSKKRS